MGVLHCDGGAPEGEQHREETADMDERNDGEEKGHGGER